MASVDLKKRFWREFENLPQEIRTYPLFLAVSGGRDSSVLAHVAQSLRDKLPPIHLVHVNYHLRTPDSDEEEAILARWAQSSGLPLYVKRFFPKTKPKNLQDWARARRYQFFQKTIAQEGQGRGLLCLGHHQKDQVETILMRLITGSGLKALGGMQSFETNGLGIPCFRPFLEVPSESIQTYARVHGISHGHDRSNDGVEYLRNRLRHRLLPLLEKENPRAAQTLVALGQKARGAQEALEEMARSWLAQHGQKGVPPREMPRRPLTELPTGLRLAVAEAFLRPHIKNTRNLGKTLETLNKALKKSGGENTLILKEKLELRVLKGKLQIGERSQPFRLKQKTLKKKPAL